MPDAPSALHLLATVACDLAEQERKSSTTGRRRPSRPRSDAKRPRRSMGEEAAAMFRWEGAAGAVGRQVTTTSSAFRVRPTAAATGSTSSPPWKEKIARMGGEHPSFVAMKELSSTDLSARHNRLLLPFKPSSTNNSAAMKSMVDELPDCDRAAMSGSEGLPVTLLDRWGREYGGATLTHWESKHWVVINRGKAWLSVAGSSDLKVGDHVDIFRSRSPQLGLLLAIVPSEEQQPPAPAPADRSHHRE